MQQSSGRCSKAKRYINKVRVVAARLRDIAMNLMVVAVRLRDIATNLTVVAASNKVENRCTKAIGYSNERRNPHKTLRLPNLLRAASRGNGSWPISSQSKLALI